MDAKLPRQSIDVQSKVAFLNSLAGQPASPSRQQGITSHSALQRALLGREEAENALRTSNAQLAEAEVRQRKISERLESMMEELQLVKERQAHERQVFEKEVRKARKDAFRAGSAMVKVQEDLKESRLEAKNLRAESQHEKLEKEKAKQEAFERAYALAGLMEEVEVMREKIKSMETAREAEQLEHQSKRMQQEEESQLQEERRRQHAPRVAEFETQSALQESSETIQIRQNRFERPVPSGPHATEAMVVNVYSKTDGSRQPREAATANSNEQLPAICAELHWERKLRERAEEMVHFLQMECHFQTCACRMAERNGRRFVHDKEYDQKTAVEAVEAREEAQDVIEQDIVHLEMEQVDEQEPQIVDLHPAEEDMFNISRQTQRYDESLKSLPIEHTSPSPGPEVLSAVTTDLTIISQQIEYSQLSLHNFSSTKNGSSPAIFSAEDMTYQSPIRTMVRPRSVCSIPLRDPPTSPPPRSPSASPYPLTPGFKTPQRQGTRIVQAQTTTMMVPLRSDDDDVFCPAPGTPGTPVSREAALAQIRARRDRARSVGLSTSKSAPGSARRGLAGGLRDISAPGRF
jgi:hypothetical protein